MHQIRYEVVSLFSGVGVKRAFARPATFTNKRVAIQHAKTNGNFAVVYDLKNGKQKIFQKG
jgi:hypothetical protein